MSIYIDREFEGLDELRKFLIDEAKGVATLLMWQVRDAYGMSKLGKHVVTGISEKLDGLGIGHYPEELSTSQNDYVRLFIKSSQAGRLLLAALSDDPEADESIRLLSADDAEDTLRRIRELVCG